MYTLMGLPWFSATQQMGFINFSRFMADLEKAINGERAAIEFYNSLNLSINSKYAGQGCYV